MRVTRLGPPVARLNSGLGLQAGSAIPGDGAALTVLTSDGSNGRYWGENVRRITSNGSNTLLSPDVNFASGSNIIFTLDAGPGGSVPSNTLRIHGQAGGGAAIAAGSNSTRVRELSTAGDSSTLWSPFDHAHDGIGTITSSASNTMQRGTWNLRPGAGIALSLTDTDGDGEFDTTTIVNTGQGGSGAGGGITRGHPLDTYAIDGTYGDDFTGSSLSGSWTRRNFTAGAETYQLGPTATWMRIETVSRAAGDGYFRTAPSGDWEFAMKHISRPGQPGSMWALAVVDTNGDGIMIQGYQAPNALLCAAVDNYIYGGSFTQRAVWHASYTTVPFRVELPMWTRLRKSGTNYYGSSSFDGDLWSEETPAKVWAGTVDRIGMLAPLGFSGSADNRIDVDWFNKIA